MVIDLHAAGDDDVGIAGAIASSPMITVCMPDPQTLLTVVACDRLGQAGLDRRLARRGLAEAGGKHAAHVDAVDVLAADARALDRRLDRGRAEVGRRGLGERALHRAHRRARDRKG